MGRVFPKVSVKHKLGGRQNTFCSVLSLGGGGGCQLQRPGRKEEKDFSETETIPLCSGDGVAAASPRPGPRQLGGVQWQEYTPQNKPRPEKMLRCGPWGCSFRKKINGDATGKVHIWGQGRECTGFPSRERKWGVGVQMHTGCKAECQRRGSDVFLMKMTCM